MASEGPSLSSGSCFLEFWAKFDMHSVLSHIMYMTQAQTQLLLAMNVSEWLQQVIVVIVL
jgi:hypothetical protein